MKKTKRIITVFIGLNSNSLKWGCRVIISGHNVDAILDSVASKQILSTVPRRMIGCIEDVAAPA